MYVPYLLSNNHTNSGILYIVFLIGEILTPEDDATSRWRKDIGKKSFSLTRRDVLCFQNVTIRGLKDTENRKKILKKK
jgi:hypothetical protein